MNDAGRAVCAGDPPGSCPVFVTGRVWCRGCTYRRQAAIVRGLPVGLPTPIGIILQDIEAPVLLCECGGVAGSWRHEESLLHREWAFRLASGVPQRRAAMVTRGGAEV